MKPINKITIGEEVYQKTEEAVKVGGFIFIIMKINELIMNQNKMLKTLNLLSKALKK